MYTQLIRGVTDFWKGIAQPQGTTVGDASLNAASDVENYINKNPKQICSSVQYPFSTFVGNVKSQIIDSQIQTLELVAPVVEQEEEVEAQVEEEVQPEAAEPEPTEEEQPQ